MKLFQTSEGALLLDIHGCNKDCSCYDLEGFTEVVPNSTDAAGEKHLPVVSREGNIVKVQVGSVSHPMTEEHSITFVFLETENGVSYFNLKPEHEPIAVFTLPNGERPIAAYAYCNLHGFWKTEIK